MKMSKQLGFDDINIDIWEGRMLICALELLCLKHPMLTKEQLIRELGPIAEKAYVNFEKEKKVTK